MIASNSKLSELSHLTLLPTLLLPCCLIFQHKSRAMNNVKSASIRTCTSPLHGRDHPADTSVSNNGLRYLQSIKEPLQKAVTCMKQGCFKRDNKPYRPENRLQYTEPPQRK
jgi:hypothetical protein